MAAFLLIPAGYWAAGAIGTALGIGATVAVSDTAEDLGEAAKAGSKLVSNITKGIVITGLIYMAYQNRSTIKELIS